MSKIIIIGAGASGIIAALKMSDDNEITILERNDKVGKKILLTGNGRCNYWNSNIDLKMYHTDDINNLSKILEIKDNVLDFLNNLGIYSKIKDGYYYPNSNQASSIREIFEKRLGKKNISIVYNTLVEDIIKENDVFSVKTNNGNYEADKVIVACGGCSYPKTGSDGNLFNVLKKYHTINPLLPSLAPLAGFDNIFKDWENVRVDAKVKLVVDDEVLDVEDGEIQLTDYGVSGIPILNLCTLVTKNLYINKRVDLFINFLPNEDNVLDLLNSKDKDLTVEEMLESILPYKLSFVLFSKCGISKDDKWKDISLGKKKELAELISNFNLEIIDTLDFVRSQVTTGGVSLKEINPNTMESLKVKGLYFIGECLDVDGKCGGFNLAFSFITGYIVGGNINV